MQQVQAMIHLPTEYVEVVLVKFDVMRRMNSSATPQTVKAWHNKTLLRFSKPARDFGIGHKTLN